MKFLLSLAIASLFLFTEGIAQAPSSCEPCASVWEPEFNYTFYHPDYPTCPLTAKFQKRTCGDVVDIKLTGGITWSGGVECMGFVNWWNSTTNDKRNQLFDWAFLSYGLEYFSSTHGGRFNCDPNSEMDCNSAGFFQMNMYSTVCTRLWDFPPSPTNQTPIHEAGQSACGASCCIHAIKFCMQGTVPRYKVCAPYASPTALCDNSLANKPAGAVWISDCINSCERPDRYIGPPRD